MNGWAECVVLSGGDLEFADGVTIAQALQARREMA